MLGRGRRLSILTLLLILPLFGSGWVSSKGGETSGVTWRRSTSGRRGVKKALLGRIASRTSSAMWAPIDPKAASRQRGRDVAAPQSVNRWSSGALEDSLTGSIRLPATARLPVSALSFYQESRELLRVCDAPRVH